MRVPPRLRCRRRGPRGRLGRGIRLVGSGGRRADVEPAQHRAGDHRGADHVHRRVRQQGERKKRPPVRRAPPDDRIRRRESGSGGAYPESCPARSGAVPAVDDLREDEPAQVGQDAEHRVHGKRDRGPQHRDGHQCRAREAPPPAARGTEQRADHHAGRDGDRETGAADEKGHGKGGDHRGNGRAQPPSRGKDRGRNRRRDREQPAERQETRDQADRDHQVDEDRGLDDLHRAQPAAGPAGHGRVRPGGAGGGLELAFGGQALRRSGRRGPRLLLVQFPQTHLGSRRLNSPLPFVRTARRSHSLGGFQKRRIGHPTVARHRYGVRAACWITFRRGGGLWRLRRRRVPLTWTISLTVTNLAGECCGTSRRRGRLDQHRQRCRAGASRRGDGEPAHGAASAGCPRRGCEPRRLPGRGRPRAAAALLP